MSRIIDSELLLLNAKYNAAQLAYENAIRARAEMSVTGTDAWEQLLEAKWTALRALARAHAEFLAALTKGGHDHTCDRKGTPAKVIDESGNEPITRLYARCSVCGVLKVFEKDCRRFFSDRKAQLL